MGREDARVQPSPWEEVRDFFHYCDNYIDAVDHAAEHFADISQKANLTLRQHAEQILRPHDITLHFTDSEVLRD